MFFIRSFWLTFLGITCSFKVEAGIESLVRLYATDPEVTFAYINKAKAGEPISATVHDGATQVPAYKYSIARRVFDALVEAKGNKAMQRPELIMAQSALFVAWMDPKRVAIGLEEKAYDVCAGFGADSLNALAAILGHELTHYYEKHDWQAPDKPEAPAQALGMVSDAGPESIKQEEQTDYLGGFLAYAAGYNAVGITPRFLTKVYQTYGLPDSLEGYPTLAERITLAEHSLARAQELVYMFETAGYLVALQQYEEAAVFYQAILKDFQSREIYNNAGVNKVLNSFQFFWYPETELRFAYPLELDIQTRLADNERRKKVLNDSVPTSPEAIACREALLQEAIQLFEQACTLDANYVTAILNKACAYQILRQYRQARYWVEEALNMATSLQQPQIQADASMLLGIIAANQEDKLAANKYFGLATAAGSTLAKLNRRLLNGEALGKEYEHSRLDLVELLLNDPPPTEGIEQVDLKKISSLVFSTSLTVAKDPTRHLSAILGIKNFDYSTLLAVSYQVDKVIKEGTDIMNSLIGIHSTTSDYPGQTAMGIKIGDSKALVLEKYSQPEGVIHLTQGDLLIYFTNDLIFQTDNAGKVIRWTVFWEGY